jgi:hypothetical protein
MVAADVKRLESTHTRTHTHTSTEGRRLSVEAQDSLVNAETKQKWKECKRQPR